MNEQITDEMVQAAVAQAYRDAAATEDGSWMPPASAKVRDYADDPDGLRDADEEAERINHATMRRILEAALAAHLSDTERAGDAG